MRHLVFVVLGLLSLTQAHSASFDCTKAASSVEIMICNDAELSKLDEELYAAYKTAIQIDGQTDTIRQIQKQWIKRRNGCINTSCLADSYKTRLTELSNIAKTKQSTNKTRSVANVCQTVVDYANRGELNKLYVPGGEEDQAKIKSLFGEYSGSTTLWNVDLDSDGLRDYFIINVDGTAQVSNGHAISGRDVKVIIDIDDEDDFDLTLISSGDKYYVLSSNGLDITKLWHMSNGKFYPVCSFKQRNKPKVEITKGKDNSVCVATIAGNVTYLAFKPVRENIFFDDENLVKGRASADVDNSGRPADISLVSYESGAGRGCSSLMIRAIDKKKPERAFFINESLASSIDGCNVKHRIFTYAGVTYIEDDRSEVIRIKDKIVEQICIFKSSNIFDVQ